MSAQTKLSWEPVKRGNIYCAPACGRGCTIQEFNHAEREALKLAVQLSSVDSDVKGGRWKVQIHENMGWHFHVRKGSVSVYKYGPGSYAACLDISGPWGGNTWANHSTPAKAVKLLLSNVRTRLREMVALAKRLNATPSDSRGPAHES